MISHGGRVLFWLGEKEVGCVAWVRVRTECCVLELDEMWVFQRGEGVLEKLS